MPVLVNIFGNKLSSQDLQSSSIVLILLTIYYILLEIYELNDSSSFLAIPYLVKSVIISVLLLIIFLVVILFLLKTLNIITFNV